jgi:hypothetical protein
MLFLESDHEPGGFRRWHSSNETPKTTVDRKLPTAQRAGVRLPNGAAHRKDATRARATATINCGPVDRVLPSGEGAEDECQEAEASQPKAPGSLKEASEGPRFLRKDLFTPRLVRFHNR